MFRRIFGTAIAAGIAAGLLLSVLHHTFTAPIIAEAEKYEKPVTASLSVAPLHAVAHSGDVRAVPVHSGTAAGQAHGHGDEAWEPADGLERIAYTTLADVLVSVGFALLLVAGFALTGESGATPRAVLWGLAGFATFTLSPGLGLPPEVPGSLSADISDRQVWWVGAAAACAVGLGLMVFARRTALKVAGVLVVAVPHLIGAPQPEQFGGSAPPELAGHFAAATIVCSAIFWAVLGWLTGGIWRRLAPA